MAKEERKRGELHDLELQKSSIRKIDVGYTKKLKGDGGTLLKAGEPMRHVPELTCGLLSYSTRPITCSGSECGVMQLTCPSRMLLY